MNPIILRTVDGITTKGYRVDNEVWLKVTITQASYTYAWFIGPTWEGSVPGSPCEAAPTTTRYAPGEYSLVWSRNGVGFHRENGPAIITRKGENMSAEWYQNGQRARSPTSGPLKLVVDPLGKEICAEILERMQTTEFAPMRQWGQLFMVTVDADVPTPIKITGNTRIERDGKLHCETGPALITYHKNGDGSYVGYGDVICYCYYINGIIHRENAPAVIYVSASGIIIREAYWVNGKRHRADGPALIQKTAAGFDVEYWFDGVKYTREEFEKITARPIETPPNDKTIDNLMVWGDRGRLIQSLTAEAQNMRAELQNMRVELQNANAAHAKEIENMRADHAKEIENTRVVTNAMAGVISDMSDARDNELNAHVSDSEIDNGDQPPPPMSECSAAESPEFTGCAINTTGTLTFGKLHELVLAKYLLLTSTDPDSEQAEKLLAYYCKIKQVEQNICDSGIVSTENIRARDFLVVYNIYVAKIAAASKLGEAIPAINYRTEFMREFYAHGVDSPGTFL